MSDEYPQNTFMEEKKNTIVNPLLSGTIVNKDTDIQRSLRSTCLSVQCDTGVYIIFLISAQNIDCVYSLEPPRRGGSNEYPQSMF